MADDVRVDGNATIYRLYDIGYAISLDGVAGLVGDIIRGRARPGREEARAFQIRNPPLVVALGAFEVKVDDMPCAAQLTARLFDFGVCSLQLRVEATPDLTWPAFTEFAAALERSPDVLPLIERELRALIERITTAIERPGIAPLSEEYKVYRIDRLDAGARTRERIPIAEVLTDARLVALLVGERRALSDAARRELVPHRFSYYDDDLVALSWESALVVEPRSDDRDVEYVLEFANAQLLELRMYDQQLDAELPALYDRAAEARVRRGRFSSRFSDVLSELQTRVADITETTERVENALKVTNDVYLARVYAAALELFREQAWRRGIERKLGILRETYAMLNGEAQALRAELLEVAIVVLIVAELIIALVGR